MSNSAEKWNQGPIADDVRTDVLRRSLRSVQDRIDRAATNANRQPGEVELLVVTKFFPADDVLRLIALGARQFGESREPEASAKIAEVRAVTGAPVTDSPASFDMIGNLQRNKVRQVAQWAHRVHSIDSARLALAVDRAAQAALDEGERVVPLRVLIQVSLDGDSARGGVTEVDLLRLAADVADSDALHLDGLMVIAPVEGDPQRWLATAAEVRDEFLLDHPEARTFSAGMSGDLEAAIAHGSTCVRVGTAIMGPRPIRSP